MRPRKHEIEAEWGRRHTLPGQAKPVGRPQRPLERLQKPLERLQGRMPGFPAGFPAFKLVLGCENRKKTGPENIQSGPNGLAMPRFEPILSGSAPVGSGMAVVALEPPAPPKIHEKHEHPHFPGSTPPPPHGMPIVHWAKPASLYYRPC